jgi:hypothetical protein
MYVTNTSPENEVANKNLKNVKMIKLHTVLPKKTFLLSTQKTARSGATPQARTLLQQVRIDLYHPTRLYAGLLKHTDKWPSMTYAGLCLSYFNRHP